MLKEFIILLNYLPIILSVMMTITLLPPSSPSPMTLLFMLISYTMISCIFISKFLSSFYFSYLMFMVTIGGILIIFMYMTSLTSKSNELEKKNKKVINLTILLNLMIMLIYIIPIMNGGLSMMFNYNIDEMMEFSKFKNKSLMTISMLYINLYKISTLCVMLLLIVLMSVVKLCTKHQGPLRQVK